MGVGVVGVVGVVWTVVVDLAVGRRRRTVPVARFIRIGRGRGSGVKERKRSKLIIKSLCK